MKDNHMSPEDSKKAFEDLGAKLMIPMHFGTFDLSNEPMSEPEEIIERIVKAEQLQILKIGQEVAL